MATKTIRQPSLYLRSGYFVDLLRANSGLGMTVIERRVRINQYEANGLIPPSYELIRDYFRLYRTVAFEPHRNEDKTAPWLLAAELEFPGCSHAFFHPLFDILFGQAESTVFWATHFSQIPKTWISDAENRGDLQLAQEWRLLNAADSRRKHRKRDIVQIDPLSFLHLSMMRLPGYISKTMFERKGLATTWSRCYSDTPKDEAAHLVLLKNIDALSALLLIAKEGAEIGDMRRFNFAKEGALKLVPCIHELPGCRRIGNLLKEVLVDELKNRTLPRRYNRTLYMGFGLPASWQAMIAKSFYDDLMTRECEFSKEGNR